jgi:hypothetical protein
MLQPKGFCYFSQAMVSLVLSQIHSQFSGPILGSSPFLGLVYTPLRKRGYLPLFEKSAFSTQGHNFRLA